MTNQEIKVRGRTALKANYWSSVVAALLLSLLASFVGGSASTSAQQNFVDLQSLSPQAVLVIASAMGVILVIAVLLRVFVFNPLEMGCYRFFRKNAADPQTKLGVIKEGFSGYGNIFWTEPYYENAKAAFYLDLKGA